MKLLLLAAVLGMTVAYCAADEEKHECGVLEKVKIRRQWAEAWGEGHHRISFALHLFQRLFHDHPEVRAQFKKYRGENIYSPEFQAQGQRILTAFGMLVDTTDDPEALGVLLKHVKDDLTAKGVNSDFYEHFRDELIDTLQETLDSHVDWDAWTACFNTLIEKLK